MCSTENARGDAASGGSNTGRVPARSQAAVAIILRVQRWEITSPACAVAPGTQREGLVAAEPDIVRTPFVASCLTVLSFGEGLEHDLQGFRVIGNCQLELVATNTVLPDEQFDSARLCL